ncbi:MAG: TonB-dependent receptor [Flavobacteriia bacterium]|nr:TonB-dependent receptor [Flavobacteriia bacterium]
MRFWLAIAVLLSSLSPLLGQEIYTYKLSIQGVNTEHLGQLSPGDLGVKFLITDQFRGGDSLYAELESALPTLNISIGYSEPRFYIDTVYQFELFPDSTTFIVLEKPVYSIGTVEIRTSFTSTVGAAGVNRSDGYWLNRDQLTARSANTLSESLDIIPGVHAVNTGVGIAKPMVRGFVGNRVQVLQNGVTQEGQQWGMDHGLEIDQFATDRIKIVNGPAALVRGAGLQSGAVEVFNDPPFRIDAGAFGEIQSLYKSNNNLFGVSGRYGYQTFDEDSKKTIYDLRLSIQDFADYRVPADGFIYNGFQLELPEGILKNTAGREWNGTFGVYRQIDDENTIRATYSHFDQSIGLFPGATGIPRSFDISNIGNRRDIQTPSQRARHDRIGVNYVNRSGKYTRTYTLGLQYNDRKELSRPHAHGLLYIDSNNFEALHLQLFTAEGKYDWTRKSYDNDLKWGARAQYQNNRQGGWEFVLPSFNRLESGVYGYYGWSNGNWNLNAAARLDGAGTTIEEYGQPWYSQPDSIVERVQQFDRLFMMPSASFGWELDLDECVLSGHTGFVSRLPEANELGSNGVHHGTFRHEIGNPELDSEYGLNLDVSLYFEESTDEWLFKSKLTTYAMNYWNFIYLSPSGSFSPLPDAGQTYVYVQSPMFQWGGEAYAELSRTLSGRNRALSLIGMADLVWSQNSSTGEFVPFQAPPSVTGLLEFSSNTGNYGVEVQNVFSQTRVARNERTTPGYTLLNLYASYSYNVPNSLSSWNFSLRVQNLTNVAYLRHLSRYRILNLPEQGFNLILQAKYSF